MLWFKKKKAGGLAILLGLTAVLSGCSDRDTGMFGETMIHSEQREEERIAGEQAEAEASFAGERGSGQEASGSTNTSQTMNTFQSTNASQAANTSLPSESVPLPELPTAVFQTEDGKLLLLGDNVILMNAATLETECCKEMTGLDFSFRDIIFSCKFAELENEYLVMGNLLSLEQKGGSGFLSSSEEPQLMLVRFSKDLEILEVLNIGEAMGVNRAIDKYDFIDNGTKLLCSSMEGFFLYDLETKMRTTYPLEEPLCGISSFGYMESENKILFVGLYDDGTRTDYQHVLGSMGLDGADLEYEKKQTHEWGEIRCLEDFALIEDGEWHENGDRASVFYYGADGKVQEWPLADEYSAIQVSETGKYFGVQSRDWAENGESTGYTVRVYASGSGQLMQEISCPLSEIGQNTMLC